MVAVAVVVAAVAAGPTGYTAGSSGSWAEEQVVGSARFVGIAAGCSYTLQIEAVAAVEWEQVVEPAVGTVVVA